MALEAVVFPGGHHLFVQTSREQQQQQLCAMSFGGAWGICDDLDDGFVRPGAEEVVDIQDKKPALPLECGEDGAGVGDLTEGMCCHDVGVVSGSRGLLFDGLQSCWGDTCGGFEDWTVMDGSSPEVAAVDSEGQGHLGSAVTGEGAASTQASCRRKRRRTKRCKNQEEVENQRMTHIAVERNRRKQMNEYLSVLRSLMPSSYVQRGDQASIIGGAINYVKELEQLLQSLEAQKRLQQQSAPEESDAAATRASGSSASAFAGFFTFPQYSTCSSSHHMASATTNSTVTATTNTSNSKDMVAEKRSAIADIEVTMVESHANLKVLSRRRPRQLIKVVMGLQNLRLTTLHLNVTTVDQMVLYSFSLKVEDDCQLTSVDEIAAAVYQLLGRIQDESGFS